MLDGIKKKSLMAKDRSDKEQRQKGTAPDGY